MQVDPDGTLRRFPLLPALPNESYEETIERSRRASVELKLQMAEKERTLAESERQLAREIGQRVRTKVGYGTQKPRFKVSRSGSAGSWTTKSASSKNKDDGAASKSGPDAERSGLHDETRLRNKEDHPVDEAIGSPSRGIG